VLNGGGEIAGPVPMVVPGQPSVRDVIGSGVVKGAPVNGVAGPDAVPSGMTVCGHANGADGITGHPGVVDPKGT
jgi:hypothetical protein